MKRDSLAHSYVREVAPRWEPDPPQPYSITRQLVRDLVLMSIAFACLAVALICWLAGGSPL